MHYFLIIAENSLLFLSSSNCPSFLAAALARATSDQVLQSDLSAHYIPKETDGSEGSVGECFLLEFKNPNVFSYLVIHGKYLQNAKSNCLYIQVDYIVALRRKLCRKTFQISKKREEKKIQVCFAKGQVGCGR